jgi:hypothetical protein
MATMLAEPAVPHIEATLMIFPLPWPDHDLEGFAGGVEHAMQVYVDHLVPGSAGHLVCRCRRGIGDAGVVEEDVEAAQLAHGGRDRGGDLLFVGDVARDARGAATMLTTAAAVCAAASESRSTQATSAPASARASANSLPSPPPAPVTRATLPVRSNSSGRDTRSPGGTR